MADTEQYLKRFTHYYRNSSKLLAMTELLLRPFIDLQNITKEYCEKLDVRTATGIYLDLIGKILGYSRNIGFTPTSGERTVLTDDEYRKLLQARQFIGRWDGTTKGFEELWAESGISWAQIYGVDNTDMTVTYGVMGNTSPLESEVMARPGYFPHTAGVGLDIHLIPVTLFGFIRYGEDEPDKSIRTGFSDYTNFRSKTGMTLTYENWRGIDEDEVQSSQQ